MGREFASAAARWIHLDDIGVRPKIVAVCDINPRTCSPGTSGSHSRPRSLDRLARPARRRPTSRRSTAPSRTTCTPSSTATSSRRQAPARREAVRHRPRRVRDDHRRGDARIPDASCAARRSCRSSPAARRSRTGCGERRCGRIIEVRSAVPALQRSRSGQADQLEAASPGSTATYGCMGDLGHARPAPPAPVRAGMPTSVSRSPHQHRHRAPRRQGRRWCPATRSDNAVLLCTCRPARRLRVPAAHRDEAHRARRDQHLDDRGRRHRGLDRVHHQAARRRCAR